eukprot:Pgem_evm1s3773
MIFSNNPIHATIAAYQHRQYQLIQAKKELQMIIQKLNTNINLENEEEKDDTTYLSEKKKAFLKDRLQIERKNLGIIRTPDIKYLNTLTHNQLLERAKVIHEEINLYQNDIDKYENDDKFTYESLGDREEV